MCQRVQACQQYKAIIVIYLLLFGMMKVQPLTLWVKWAFSRTSCCFKSFPSPAGFTAGAGLQALLVPSFLGLPARRAGNLAWAGQVYSPFEMSCSSVSNEMLLSFVGNVGILMFCL